MSLHCDEYFVQDNIPDSDDRWDLSGIFFPSVVLGPVYEDIKKEAETKGFSIPESKKDIKDFPLVYNVGIALFAFGIFLFVVSTLGWCGSCCSSYCRWMLVVFSLIMLMLMIAEITVGTMFLKRDSALHDKLKDTLKEKIKSDYDDKGKDPFSMAMNLVNAYYKCCGVEGIQDFGKKEVRSCAEDNKQTGCYVKLTELVRDNIKWAAVVFAGILLVQLIEVIFPIVVFNSDNKDRQAIVIINSNTRARPI